MPKRISAIRLAALALAALVGLGLAAITVGAVPASISSAAPAITDAPPGSAVDPRWLSLVRALSAAPAGQAPASAGPTLNYLITDQVLVGHVPLPNTTVVVSVTSQGNTLFGANLTPFPDGTDLLYTVNFNTTRFAFQPQPGEVIWVTQASASVSLTVPVLNGLAWPLADVVSGTAPAGAALQLFLYPYSNPATAYTTTTTADGAGSYQAAWSPGTDLRPRDSGFVVYAPDPSRQIYARFVAPFLHAQVGGYNIDGQSAPSSGVFVTVTTGAGILLGTGGYGRADSTGSFAVCYGACQYPSSLTTGGDVVWATAAGQTFSLTLPALTARRLGDLVAGQAPPGEAVRIVRLAGPAPAYGDLGPPLSQTTVTASVTGDYSVTLPLQPPNYGEATVSDSEGNEAYARYAVPYLSAVLGQGLNGAGYHITGQVDDPGAPLTITIQGASGFLKSVRLTTAISTGLFDDPRGSPWTGIALAAGDQITVATPRGVAITDTLPLLTAQADAVAQTISGQAPPNAPVSLNLSGYDVVFNPPGGSDQTFVVTASAQGSYSFSFAPFGSFGSGVQGVAAYTGPQGQVAQLAFTALQNCLPNLLSAQVGGDHLSAAFGYFTGDCGSATLTLRDGQGQVKYTQTIEAYPNEAYYLSLLANGFQPVIIQPGDHIQFTSSVQPQASDYLVPPLSVAADQPGGHISGQAPANAALALVIKNDGFIHGSADSWASVTTTASAQGAYLLGYPLRPGDQVEATLSGRPSFYVDAAAPVLLALLYQTAFQAWAAPFAPYTLTLPASHPITPLLITGTTDAFGYASYINWQQPWALPGDMAVFTAGTTVRTLTMPSLTARLDQAGQAVTGLGPAGQSLLVTLGFSTQAVTVSAQGRYTATFTPPTSGTFGRVIFTNSSGDQAGLTFSAANWQVQLDELCFHGYVPLPGVSTTITLTAAGGSARGTLHFSSNLDGSYVGCFPTAIESGDQFTLTAAGAAFTFTVPTLTARDDGNRQLVIGQGPPNSLVTVILPDARLGGKPVDVRTVLTGADGRYTIDVSDVPLRLGGTGFVTWQDQQGDIVQRNFTIQGRHTFFPFLARP